MRMTFCFFVVREDGVRRIDIDMHVYIDIDMRMNFLFVREEGVRIDIHMHMYMDIDMHMSFFCFCQTIPGILDATRSLSESIPTRDRPPHLHKRPQNRP